MAWILALVGIVIVPPVLLAIWYASLRTSNNSAIRTLEQDVRQTGEPLTLTELATNYPAIPDEDNVAEALMEIWSKEEPEFWAAFKAGAQLLPDKRSENYSPALPYLGKDARRIPRDVPLSPESLAATDEFLTENAAHFEAVRAALRRPQFRFDIAFEDGPAALLPHLSQIKSEANAFRIAALAGAAHGNVAGSIHAIEDTLRCGQLLSTEPTLISQLVRVACLSLALESMEQLLSRQPLNVAQLDQLRAMLERANLEGVARNTLVYERPFCLASFDPQVMAQTLTNPAPGDSAEEAAENASNVRKGFSVLRAAGYLTPDRKLMLETFKQAIALAELESPDSLVQYKALIDDASAKARKFPPKLFSSLMLPSLERIPEKFASYEARRRAALTAIAIEQFRLAHNGELPEQLEALLTEYISAVPQDPFDSKNLRFEKLATGFVVYSVGDDREDNRGKEYTRGRREHTDLTFIVLR